MSSGGGHTAHASTFKRNNSITNYFQAATSDTSTKCLNRFKSEVIVISSDDEDVEITIDLSKNCFKPKHVKSASSQFKPDVIDLTIDLKSPQNTKCQTSPANEVIVLDENKTFGDRNIWSLISTWDSTNDDGKLHEIEPNTNGIDYKSKNVTKDLKRKNEFISPIDSKKCKVENFEVLNPIKNDSSKDISLLSNTSTKSNYDFYTSASKQVISQGLSQEKHPEKELVPSLDLNIKDHQIFNDDVLCNHTITLQDTECSFAVADESNITMESEENYLHSSRKKSDSSTSDHGMDIYDMYNIEDSSAENRNSSENSIFGNLPHDLPAFQPNEMANDNCCYKDHNCTNTQSIDLDKSPQFPDLDNSNSYHSKYIDFSNNNCNKEDLFNARSELFDSPLKSSQDSLNLSQDANPRVILRKLNLVQGDGPITPRSHKFQKLKFEDSEVYFDTTQIFETASRKKLKPKKIKYTLKSMLKDKIRSDKIKSLERELNELDRGGITSEEEEIGDENLMNKESPVGGDEIDLIRKTVGKSDDCLGLPTTLPKLPLFSCANICSQFCPHSLENSYHFSSLDHVLYEIRMKTIQLKTAKYKDDIDEMIIFLLKLMSCYYDLHIINSIESILIPLVKSSAPSIVNGRSERYSKLFHQLFINVGLKLNGGEIRLDGLSDNNCQICKKKKINFRMVSRTFTPLIKVFLAVADNILQLGDNIISQYIILFTKLLTIQHNVQLALSEAILFLLDKAVDWPTVRLVCTTELVEKVCDFKVCENICTLLPCKSLRSQQFKRSISQFILEKIIQNTDTKQIVLNGIDTADFEPLQKLSNHLKTRCLKACSTLSSPSIRQQFIIFWICFLMLQHSVGIEKIHPNNRKYLEQIIDNVWISYNGVRDNGCLYLFEFKNYVRVIHDKLNSQLKQMPKPKATATGIFKYLCEKRVNTNYVIASQSPVHEDSDLSNDVHLMSITS